MSALSPDYFLKHKWLALTGALCGAGIVAILHTGNLVARIGFALSALLSFPFTPTTSNEKLLRLVLIYFYLFLALALISKTSTLFSAICYLGSAVLGAIVVCVRYKSLLMRLQKLLFELKNQALQFVNDFS